MLRSKIVLMYARSAISQRSSTLLRDLEEIRFAVRRIKRKDFESLDAIALHFFPIQKAENPYPV